MEHWYAVHTKARDERLAEENLQRQGFATFLPRIKGSKHRRGRWLEVVEPLFPGYLFTRLDLLLQDTSPIRSTRGVLGLVRFGGDPAPVPPGLVEQLMAATASEDGVVRQEHLFHPGDQVEIVTGPFAGLPASILAETGKERVELLLELLGRANKVVISRHQLTPAP
ncbi:MAG: transcriptional activator RfaH [Chromatiaceae bacterium]